MKHRPTHIHYDRTKRVLTLDYGSAHTFQLSAEFLRVHSPSAEVQGHGFGQAKLVTDKQNVTIKAIEPVGQYAIKLCFDDGHDSGLYSWDYLHHIGSNHNTLWEAYIKRCQQIQYDAS